MRSAKARVLLVFAPLLAAGCAGEGPRDAGDERRVLVVGWDGATWELIDPLLAAGLLPNLAGLIERGSSAELESTWIPISSAAWAAATTGQNPGKSGVYGFFEPVPGSYATRLIDARSLGATPIWRTLSRRGRASVVFGVPVTFPPEPIQGTLVAGMLAPEDAVYSYPGELSETLRAQGFLPDLGMWRREAPVLEAGEVARQLELKDAALVELLSRRDWSLAFVVYKCLDVLSHAAYRPALEGPDGVVARHLIALDRSLGTLVAAAGPGVDVLVASDHGFTLHERIFDPLGWLLAEGFAEPAHAAERPAAGGASEALALAQPARELARLALLDLERSQLLPGPCEGRYGSLRVNLAGREPTGPVSPDERAALVRRAIERLLLARTPEGEPLVVRAQAAAELYPGPFADRCPDLLFELAPGILARAEGGPVLRRMPPFPDHDRVGILVAAGPHLVAQGARQSAAVADLAPTVLALLLEPLYPGLDGAPRSELLLETAVRFAPESGDPPDLAGLAGFLEQGASEAEVRELEEALSGLGYTR